MQSPDVQGSLRRYVADASQPSLGPIGAAERKRYRIDGNRATRWLMTDLELDHDAAFAALRQFAQRAGGTERRSGGERRDEVGRTRRSKVFTDFEIPVSAFEP